jgi:hypothetical protein
MVSLSTQYLGNVSAASVTFYYDGIGAEEMCAFTDVQSDQELICTIDADADYSKMKSNTEFSIVYSDSDMDDCTGSFHTSCSRDILGAFGGDGCNDLVVVGWSDIEGGVCYGTVNTTKPSTQATSSGAKSSKKAKAKKRWKKKSKGSDSSDPDRRRRRLGGNGKAWTTAKKSSDSKSSKTFKSDYNWYTNKLCIPSCKEWGLLRARFYGTLER